MSNVLNDLEQPSSSPIAGQDVQKGPSSKASGALARGAYTGVREHDKGPRTQLADFFNILLVLEMDKPFELVGLGMAGQY